MSDGAAVGRRTRQTRLSAEQREQVRKLYLIDQLTEQQIADRVPGITRKTVNNFVYRNGLAAKRTQLERRKEVASQKAVESLLQRVEKRLASSAENAVSLFEETLADAALVGGTKRLTELQSAKAALSIVNDVSGRDRESKAASGPVFHLHAHAWAPVRVDAMPVESAQPVVIPPQLPESQ